MSLKMNITSDKTFVPVDESIITTVTIENEGKEIVDITRLEVELPQTVCTSNITVTQEKRKIDELDEREKFEKKDYIETLEEKQQALEKEQVLEKETLLCKDTSNIKISNIGPGQKLTVSIESTLEEIPEPSTQRISAKVYNDKDILPLEKVESEPVDFGLQKSILTTEIKSDQNAVLVGDEFIYTITLRNESNTETANDIKLITSKPDEFEELETLVDDKIPAGGNLYAKDINLGLEIPSISPNTTVEITSRIKVNDMPNENPYISKANAKYINEKDDEVALEEFEDEPGVEVVDLKVNGGLGVSKSISNQAAQIGDIVTITLVATNNHPSYDFEDVIVTDELPNELSFINDSLFINGINYPGENPLSGIDLGTMSPQDTNIITFDVEVVGPVTEDITRLINVGNIKGFYIFDGTVFTATGTSITGISIFKPALTISKTAVPSQEPLMLGDTIDYTITVVNTSTRFVEDFILFDLLPSGVQLNPNSISITSPTATTVINNPDLENGLYLPSIQANSTYVFNYSVEVIGGTCSGKLINEAFAQYEFPAFQGINLEFETEHVSTSFDVRISNFVQSVIGSTCLIPTKKPSIEEVNDVKVEIEIVSAYPVKTYKGISNEGYVLSGYKLIINGIFNIMIQYTADLQTQSIHNVNCREPFGGFIILPIDYEIGMNTNVSAIVEDVEANMINDREIDVNIVYLLNGSICG